jgi:hypothetical protein
MIAPRRPADAAFAVALVSLGIAVYLAVTQKSEQPSAASLPRIWVGENHAEVGWGAQF